MGRATRASITHAIDVLTLRLIEAEADAAACRTGLAILREESTTPARQEQQ